MAIVSKGSPLYGVSGKIGDIVVRQRNGKTIVSRAPRRSKQAPSEAQQAQWAKFTAMVKAKLKK